MAALNVDKVFRFVQFVANKQSRGWVSPEEFNIAAEVANIIAYSKREALYAATKKIETDMLPFIANLSSTVDVNSKILYSVLTGFRFFISSYTTEEKYPILELVPGEVGDALNSTIINPSLTYPAVEQESLGLSFYPDLAGVDVSVRYLKLPTAPIWNYTLVSSRPVYYSLGAGGGVIGDGDSVDFEFSEILFDEIAGYVLANVGMNLKQEEVTKYASSFNAQQ